jgi:hypothetical protein
MQGRLTLLARLLLLFKKCEQSVRSEAAQHLERRVDMGLST